MTERPDNVVPITPDARSAAEKFGAEHDRELLTILFTDLVDSTKLQSDLGNVEAARLTELHREIVREELAKYDAREIEWAGDSCLAVFTKPSDGVVFALKLQAALRQSRESEPKMPTVRIGLHLGEIVVRKHDDGGKRTEDLFGLQVSEAARVMSLARGDQIYCTRAVFENARSSLKGRSIEGVDDLQWREHGNFELKGSENLVEVCEVGDAAHAPLKPPEANDKCRPYRGDPAKWRRRRAKAGQQRRGVPAGTMIGVAAATLLVGLLLGLGLGRQSASAPATVSLADEPIRSIAVIPFGKLMEDPGQDYFADGMTEAIIAELSKISAFDKVTSRTSVMQYKDTTKTMPEIASELGVEGIIEGSVLLDGDQVRVTVQLIHGPTDNHLWTATYDNTYENILQIHSDIALDVARELRATLSGDEQTRLARADQVDPEAYDLYLQSTTAPETGAQYSKNIKLLTRAVEIDPDFAQGWSALSDSHQVIANIGLASTDDHFAKAEDAAQRALVLDDSLSEAHMSLHFIRLYRDGDWREADFQVRRALELGPQLITPHTWNAMKLISAGDLESAATYARRAIELDPDHILQASMAARVLSITGYVEQSVAFVEALVEKHPNDPAALTNLGFCYYQAGDLARALTLGLEEARLRGESFAPAQLRNAHLLAELGREQEAKELVDAVMERATQPFFSFLVHYYVAIGDLDQAFDVLKIGVEDLRWDTFVALRIQLPLQRIQDLPHWQAFVSDPRYWEACERVNFPPLPADHPLYKYEQDWKLRKAAEAALAAQPKAVRRLSMTLDPPLAPRVQNNSPRALEISRDGRVLVYRSGREPLTQLYLRPLDDLESRPIRGTEGARTFFLSPDGEWVAFEKDASLYKARINGTEIEKLLADNFVDTFGGYWDIQGYLYITQGGTRILRVPASGGPPEPVYDATARFENEVALGFPHAPVDGRAILFNSVRSGGIDAYRIAVTQVDTGEWAILIDKATRPEYAPTGHIVGAREGGLVAAPISLRGLKTVGEQAPITLPDLLDTYTYPVDWTFSQDGTLVYARSGGVGAGTDRSVVWVDRAGDEEPAGAETAQHVRPRVSPDGRRMLSIINTKLWVRNFETGRSIQLTFDNAILYVALWSKEGEYIYYISFQEEGIGLYRIRSDGSERAERITSFDSFPRLSSMSRDGSRLYATKTGSDARRGIFTIDLSTGEETEVIQSAGDVRDGVESPDGKWLAYMSNESGRNEVYLAALSNVERRWPVSTGGGEFPMWHPSGRELFFVRGDDHRLMSVEVELNVPPIIGTPDVVLEGYDFRPSTFVANFDIAPDGDRFLVLKSETLEAGTGATELVVVENWFEELKRLAPHPEAN